MLGVLHACMMLQDVRFDISLMAGVGWSGTLVLVNLAYKLPCCGPWRKQVGGSTATE